LNSAQGIGGAVFLLAALGFPALSGEGLADAGLSGLEVECHASGESRAHEATASIPAQVRDLCERMSWDAALLLPAEQPVRVRVYGTHEAKALDMGSVESFSLAEDGRTLAVVVDEELVSRSDGRGVARMLLELAWGAPGRPVFEDGLPYLLGSESSRRESRLLAAWIAAAGEATTVAELLDPAAYGRRTMLLQAPLGAVLGEWILERGGAAALAQAWRGETPQPMPREDEWQDWLDGLVREHAAELRAHRQERAQRRPLSEHRGICFSHEGYRIHDGYVSQQADRSLEEAWQRGARSVAFTPFGYYRDVNLPEIRWPRRSARPGTETDESVLVACARARGRGMITLLKPHLWGHGWCGEIRMTNEEDWQRWFQEYGEFLVHYALLAELGGFEWFSVGCELVQTTRDHEDEWRALVGRARRLFAGGLTYSANWGEEAQDLSFADALDAVGVDHYAPLSEAADPDPEELVRAARRHLAELAALSRRYGRPLLLTEVGFPNRALPWFEPHRAGRREPLDPAAQVRCMEAFLQAWRERPDRDVIGFYWWKWPSYDRFLERPREYWPGSPEALEVLERLFEAPPN